MIVADDIVAEEVRDARQGVAEDRAADMADVHRLGDVRRTEIDRRCVSGRSVARDPEPFVVQEIVRFCARRLLAAA